MSFTNTVRYTYSLTRECTTVLFPQVAGQMDSQRSMRPLGWRAENEMGGLGNRSWRKVSPGPVSCKGRLRETGPKCSFSPFCNASNQSWRSSAKTVSHLPTTISIGPAKRLITLHYFRVPRAIVCQALFRIFKSIELTIPYQSRESAQCRPNRDGRVIWPRCHRQGGTLRRSQGRICWVFQGKKERPLLKSVQQHKGRPVGFRYQYLSGSIN